MDTVRSVLVIVTRQIGDVLLTTPLIRAARRRWPEAAVDVIGLEGTLGMLEGNPDVREALEMPQRPSTRDLRQLVGRLWRRYDLALVADAGDRAHLLAWLASRQRAGLLPERHRSNWWKRRLLAHAVTLGGDLSGSHVVPERLRLLDPWQPPPGAPMLVPPAALPLPPPLQERLAPGYVVMHTPSMWAYKRWPIGHFRQLAALLAQAGRQIVLTGGPGREDRECIQAMQGAAPAALLLDAGVLGFGQLATLLRGSALYIGPDTSVSHLAAACGAQVLAIFGPTNPQRWAPWPGEAEGRPVQLLRRAEVQRSGRVTLLQAPLPCVPCGKAGCEDHRKSRTECLPSIGPQRVAAQALELLEASGR
jgi:heptosyltransferase III